MPYQVTARAMGWLVVAALFGVGLVRVWMALAGG